VQLAARLLLRGGGWRVVSSEPASGNRRPAPQCGRLAGREAGPPSRTTPVTGHRLRSAPNGGPAARSLEASRRDLPRIGAVAKRKTKG
jgi:hypothetical protein